MHYRALGRTGLNVSVLSFGASPLGGAFRQTDDQESIRAVHRALDLGINLFDTSPYYGNTRSETVLGKAMKGIDRSRYYMATKVGQYGTGQFDFSAKRVLSSFEESCARLGTDYIDLLQCHDVEFVDLRQVIDETVPALLKLKKDGRIGAIGVTGLPLKIFRTLLDQVGTGVFDAILSFCHYELNDSSLAGLIPYLEDKQVAVINAAPTGMGLLTERGAPSWHPAPKPIQETARKAVAYCQAHGLDIVKLALQYSLSHPGIATTVVGTASAENIAKNVAAANAPVDFAGIAGVLEILKPIANHNFTRGLPENRDPILA